MKEFLSRVAELKRQAKSLDCKRGKFHVSRVNMILITWTKLGLNEISQKFREIWEDHGSSSTTLINSTLPINFWLLSETTASNPLAKIHTQALKMPGFPAVSKATLLRWVKKLGFVCKRRNRKLQVYQRLDIVVSRQRYLQRVRELRSGGYKVFYQDETWCNANHTREYISQLDDETERDIPGTQWKGGLKVPTGNGKRLIVNHLGSEDGFLNGCEECFVGAKDKITKCKLP